MTDLVPVAPATVAVPVQSGEDAAIAAWLRAQPSEHTRRMSSQRRCDAETAEYLGILARCELDTGHSDRHAASVVAGAPDPADLRWDDISGDA